MGDTGITGVRESGRRALSAVKVYPWLTVRPRRGANIYEIGGHCIAMMRAAGKTYGDISAFRAEISRATSYEAACKVVDRWFDAQWSDDEN